MFKTLKTVMNISVSSNINWFIYYIKRIPVIGKLFNNVKFFGIQSKKKLSTALLIFKMLEEFINVAISALIIIVFPLLLALSKGADSTTSGASNLGFQSFLHLYFILYFMFSGILNSYILEAKRMKFICVKLMHMDPYDYSVSVLFSKKIWNMIASFPTVIGLSLFYGGTLLQGILLCVLAKLMGFVGESIHLWYYKKWHKILHKNTYFMFGGILLLLAAAYVPIFLHIPLPIEEIIFNPIFILVLDVIGMYSIKYILQYTEYKEAINESNQLADIAAINVQQTSRESRFADVKLKENQFAKEDLNTQKFNQMKGYEYLNALFFDRHRAQIRKPILRRILIIVVIFILGLVATYRMDNFAVEFEKLVNQKFPLMIFIMYMLSAVVQRATRAMFYNCDISLLHFGFYKKDNALLKMFWLRFNYLAPLNLLPAIFMGSFLLILAYLNRPSMVTIMFPIVMLALLLSLFFTVHHLFLYYILQPYTTELNMKNPAYNIINTITYMICWACTYIKTPPSYFMMIITAATIIYIVLALILVSKFASKTFVVK